ncbi:MAG: LysR family transcriptional regulator [Roseivirga sp.]|nr:LysR family transcriptional regulator [Roseivirga sp.]
MTLQQLEYIVALDNHRHFVRAAENCFVTQPTLTLQIQKLEDEMGSQIFDRSKHPIEPTPLGEMVILKARQILREAMQLKELVNEQKDGVTGTFRLGVIPTLAPYLIPRFLKQFSSKYPKTRLVIREMESESIIKGLKNDLIDLGLLVTPLDENSLRELPLFNEPFLIYSSQSHPYYVKKEIKPEDISDKGLWLLNQGHCFRNQVLNICNSRSSAGGNVTYESGSIETLKNLVKWNMGYTLVPELAITHELDNPMLKRFTSPEPVREVSLVVHNSFTKEALLKNLRDEILQNIPTHFSKSRKFIQVKWR